MVLGSFTSDSHCVLHYSRVSSSASPHCVYLLLFLFLLYLSTIYLLILVAPGLWVSGGGLRSAMFCPYWVVLDWALSQVWSAYLAPVSRGNLRGVLPVYTVWYQAGGHLEHDLPAWPHGTGQGALRE